MGRIAELEAELVEVKGKIRDQEELARMARTERETMREERDNALEQRDYWAQRSARQAGYIALFLDMGGEITEGPPNDYGERPLNFSHSNGRDLCGEGHPPLARKQDTRF